LELDHPDEDIASFLRRFAIQSNMTRNRGTLWPRSELHHVPIRPDVMSTLAELAEVRAEHDVADPIFVARVIEERAVSAFARSVGGELDDV